MMDVLTRLGNVLYWIGWIIAALICFVGGLYFWTDDGGILQRFAVLLTCGIAAAIFHGIGSTLQYILAGSRSNSECSPDKVKV
jgi:hypothetical protein